MLFKNGLIVMLAFTLCACTIPTRMRNLSINDSFTANALKDGKMIYGGMVSSQDDWTEKQADMYSDLARSTISSHREDIHLSEPTYLIEHLGKEEFYRIQQEFAKNHELTKESITKISTASNSPRYIMFSRLLSDRVDHQENQHENKTSDGKTERVMEYKTTRHVVVHTKVYDLISSDVVLSGEMWQNDNNTGSGSSRHNGSFLQNLVVDFLRSEPTYPEPPSLEGMLEKAFTGIAENLPHKSCKETGLAECIKHPTKSFLW